MQELLVEERLVAGARRVGRKIGRISPAVQAQLGLDQPDFRTLLDSMAVTAEVPARVLLQPRIEAEVVVCATSATAG